VKLLASLSILLLITACVEDVASPGVCPDFCPPANIRVVDTVFTGSVVRDSSYRGYVPTHRATSLQVTTGGVVESYAVILFDRFDAEVRLDTATTDEVPVIAVDSFGVNLIVDARSPGTGDFELAFFRLPVSVDSATTYADVQSTFSDSVEIAAASFSDVEAEDTIAVILPGDAFPALVDDSAVAVGIAVRSANPAYVDFKSMNSALDQVSITRFVQVDSADGEAAARTDRTLGVFDTFLYPDLPEAGATTLQVGGSPSARAFLKVDLPAVVADSSNVIRATLLLVPAEPVVGAPGDTIRILAEGLAADIGPKSPIRQVPDDSIGTYSGLTTVGSTDTLRIDITHVVEPWRNNPTLVRTFMLRAVREAGTLGEFRFHSSSSAMGTPALHVTFIPPVAIGN
jgi:hypothetical protein